MAFSDLLIQWYSNHKRDLPWRQTNDPFHRWLSEVILQQTRVAQGTDYYLRFTDRFATVTDLAEAPEDEVLRLWQGLGYYSRARNLHAAAKQVVNEHGGVFPSTYTDIRSLKGVGPYTAAAIASIVFHEPHAVVDGNVYRVLARWFDIDTPIDSTAGKKEFAELAQSLLPTNDPGEYNEALMEFGATHCTPKKPACPTCSFQSKCLAFARGTVLQRPIKKGKTKQRDRFFHYLLIMHGDDCLIQQRGDQDIWKKLFEFPLVEGNALLEWPEVQAQETDPISWKQPNDLILLFVSPSVKHILSHQRIYARFFELELSHKPPSIPPTQQWVNKRDLSAYALPRLLTRYLQQRGWAV